MNAPTSLASRTVAPGNSLLGRLLVADAVLTVPMAAAFVLGASPLADLTGVAAATLRAIGLGLLALAALFLVVGRSRPVPVQAACALVVVNVLWVGASVLALSELWWPLTGWGSLMIAVQGTVVAVLAIAQIMAGISGVRTREVAGDANA